jgi:ATP-dependent DNA helicase RecQ
MPESPKDILRRYWGYDQFRPLQEDIVKAVLKGNDVLALLPTGGGKSVCYQVPALIREGIAIVVSPLIALMQDQVGQLRKKGIPVLILQNGMTFPEIRKTLEQAAYGPFKFLFVSPERLQTSLFREFLPAMKLSLIAVDEAHCVSQWGYDFRPSYLNIAATSGEKPEVPVLALTATATREVQGDITEKLGMKAPAIFLQSFHRPNLSYSVIRTWARISKLSDILNKVDGSAIVYCRTRKKTQEVCAALEEHSLNVSFYHAGLSREQRESRQEDWISNRTRIMVCTNAFGMGIDKPDVRIVIHMDTPDNLESYGQEAGRAGRDGLRSYAVLLHNPSEQEEIDKLVADRYPSLDIIRSVYQGLANHLQVPVGSGEDEYYEFDLAAFCKAFKFPVQLVLNVVQTLQQESILSFQDQVFQPAKVEVLARKDRLENFCIQQPEAGELLKALLRGYGGILDSPVPISEKQIAFSLRTPLQWVTETLTKLDQSGMIHYLSRKDTPQIRFLQGRIRSGDLRIDMDRYSRLKESFRVRLKAMAGYLDHSGCRSGYLEKYFGFESEKTCGVCDNCIREKKAGLVPGEFETIAESLEKKIREGRNKASELLDGLMGADLEKARKVLEEWSEEQKITIDQRGRIKLL